MSAARAELKEWLRVLDQIGSRHRRLRPEHVSASSFETICVEIAYASRGIRRALRELK